MKCQLCMVSYEATEAAANIFIHQTRFMDLF